MGRGGKLVFAPGLSGSAGQRSQMGGSAFIWDVTANRGYLLNDPLQACAPIPSTPVHQYHGQQPLNGAAPENVSGHPCQLAEQRWRRTMGPQRSFVSGGRRIERAPGPYHLRLERIAAYSHLVPIRLETMPDDLFLPPKDFTKYDSAAV